MSAEALARDLAALGLPGRVEVRGKMAVLIARDPARAGDPTVRAAAAAAAARHGFTNLALDLDGADDGAALPGD